MQGKSALARAQFEETLRLRPDFADAHMNLARAITEQNQLSSAALHLREALRLDAQNTRARQLLESTLERQKSGR